MLTLGNILLHLAWIFFWMVVGSYTLNLPKFRQLVKMIRKAREEGIKEGFEAGLSLGMEIAQAVLKRKDEENAKGADRFSRN